MSQFSYGPPAFRCAIGHPQNSAEHMTACNTNMLLPYLSKPMTPMSQFSYGPPVFCCAIGHPQNSAEHMTDCNTNMLNTWNADCLKYCQTHFKFEESRKNPDGTENSTNMEYDGPAFGMPPIIPRY
ncbi:uncharacterized protein LOC134260280 [Saccostrea cucullata]|uniref:uncharacterized protein LOC134260280 n=1 Tax=Saccostrea cuccullata TaxID=36930 RepID=UPI002ED0293D